MAKYKGVVLVVDDEAPVRELAARVLKRRGYVVLEAVDGHAAVEMADAARGKVQLLLTDVVLPGMPGDELARTLRARNPDLRVVFMSGYEETELADRGIDSIGAAYVTKPFTADVLVMVVAGALGDG